MGYAVDKFFEYTFWIINHLIMKLRQLTDTIIGNMFRKHSALYFILHKYWVLNPSPFQFSNLLQQIKNQLGQVCVILLFWRCALRPSKKVNTIDKFIDHIVSNQFACGKCLNWSKKIKRLPTDLKLQLNI